MDYVKEQEMKLIFNLLVGKIFTSVLENVKFKNSKSWIGLDGIEFFRNLSVNSEPVQFIKIL